MERAIRLRLLQYAQHAKRMLSKGEGEGDGEGHTPATTATHRARCVCCQSIRCACCALHTQQASVTHSIRSSSSRIRLILCACCQSIRSRRLSCTAYAAAAVAAADVGPSSPSDNPIRRMHTYAPLHEACAGVCRRMPLSIRRNYDTDT